MRRREGISCVSADGPVGAKDGAVQKADRHPCWQEQALVPARQRMNQPAPALPLILAFAPAAKITAEAKEMTLAISNFRQID